MTSIAIFVSGEGTNCENIIRHFAHNRSIKVSLVVSNRPDAPAIGRAQRLGVGTCVIDKATLADKQATLDVLRRYHIDFIVLAGFLLMIPQWLVEAYRHRMINLHPALLPKHGGKGMYGLHVHEAVKAAGDTETGMTVHWVTNEYDSGDIIAQRSVSLSPTDTVLDIARKEHELEMAHFPDIIERIIGSTNHLPRVK